MHVIIMAGGAGTRFWPLSRLHRPKQFLTIIGTRPMIEEAFLRIAPLTDEGKIYIVVHEDHRELTKEIFTGKSARIVAEPMSRNTASCIGLGLIHIMAEHGDGPVVVLPADHYVGDLKAFQRTIRRAVSLAEQGGIATIGIVPTRPETGYGYIKGGNPLSGKGEALRVDAFVEKPSLERATHFLSKGGYYWNAGIFVFRAQTMMDEIQRCLPELYEGLTYVRKFLGTEDYAQKIREVYESLTPISIDYGVMEKTTADVFVIPGHFPWSDVGNWRSIFELRSHEQDTEGNIVDGDAIIINCKNTMVHSRSGRLTGCIGLEDIMIVDTPDALLICHHGCTQDVRRCVELIKERGRDDLL